MGAYKMLLFVHLLAVMVWLGGAIVGMLIGARLRRADDAAPFAQFSAAFAQVAGPVFGGSSLLVLITGIWMVSLEGGPQFDETWVSIGFAGWFVSTLLGATIVGRSWLRLGNRLGEPEATLSAVDALARRAMRLTTLDLLVRTAVVFVMVWKPGA